MSNLEKQTKGPKGQRAQETVDRAVAAALKLSKYPAKQSITKVIKDYKSNNAELLSAIKELDRKVSTVTRKKVSGGMLNKYAVDKSGVQDFKALRLSLGDDAKGIPSRILRELVALDDWSTIAKTAIPLITQYGIPYLKKLYEKHVRPFLGGDEGINDVDWGGNALAPFRYTPAEGVNMFGVGTKDKSIYDSGPMIASSHSLATAICPSAYHHRFTSPGLYKSALGYVTTQYSIVANASGVVGCSISVDRACNGTDFFKVWNGTDFDPSTGSQTANCSSVKGPFYDTVSAVGMFRVVQMSIEIQPSISFNTPGILTMGYSTTLSTNPSNMGITQSDVRTLPFNTGGSVKAMYRMVTPFSAISELDFLAITGTGTDGFVIFGTGLGSAVTLNTVINTVIEFVPTKAFFPICPVDYPEPGPQTFALITQLFARFPVLQQLTSKDAFVIAQKVFGRSSNYQELIELVSDALSGITHQAAPLVGSNELAMFEGAGPIMAFE